LEESIPMADERDSEWLRPVVKKAVADALGEEPKEVFIQESNITVVIGAPFKPTYKVWARVVMAERTHCVFLNVGVEGSYSNFKILESSP
jgi:hypothetical protein